MTSSPTPVLPDARAREVLIEKLREVAALEDSNMKRHAHAVRTFAAEAADYLATPPASDGAVPAGTWQPIETVDRVNGRRLILAWDDRPTLFYHWEVGRWSRDKGWVSTYGHAFAGEPTHWMEPAEPSAAAAPKVASDTGAGLLREAASLAGRIEAAGALVDEGSNFERWKATARDLAPRLRAALATDATDGATGGGEVLS